jgi:hypothetical protein
MIITLWDAVGLAATAQQVEDALSLVSDASDTGVTSRTYEVLGFIPSPDGIPNVALTGA